MTVLIIGDVADEHVRAVRDAIPVQPVRVLDVDSISDAPYQWTAGQWTISAADAPTRGWIRRLVRPQWGQGMVAQSHNAVVAAARLAAFSHLLRSPDIDWLTDLDDGLVAENKLTQAQAVLDLGIAHPRTAVTNDVDRARAIIGDIAVVKPLGPGHFVQGADSLVVFAQQVDLTHIDPAAFAAAPFLIQEKLTARAHLRVVTVNDQTWVSELDATDRPLDWRTDPGAHQSFRPATGAHDDITRQAAALAHHLRLGYTSQDWVLTDHGPYFLDINPGGQWLFLPSTQAAEITAAFAAWLAGGSR